MCANGSGESLVQKLFDRVAIMLRWLAGEAGAELPGITGSVVTFFLRTAAEVVEVKERICILRLLLLWPSLLIMWERQEKTVRFAFNVITSRRTLLAHSSYHPYIC